MKKIILIAAIAVSSCNDSETIVEGSYKNQFIITSEEASSIPFIVTTPSDFNPAIDLYKIEKFYLETGIKAVNIKEKDWEQLDTDYRNLISKYKNHIYHSCLQQVLAQNILISKNVLSMNDKKAVEAIQYYTEQLTKANSTNTVLMYYALSKLEAYGMKNHEVKNKANKTVKAFNEIVVKKREARKASFSEEIALERKNNPNSSRLKLHDKINNQFLLNERLQLEYADKLKKITEN